MDGKRSCIGSLVVLLFFFCSISYADESALTESVNTVQREDAVRVSRTIDDQYLTALVQTAREKKLANHPMWLALGHYKNNWLGGKTSQVDDPNFFLSRHGKDDPQGELEATLSSFFSSDVNEFTKLTGQCRYVARYAWLKNELNFDSRRLPEQNCERFNLLVKELNVKAITVIFASAHPGGPASMFGHTLIRFDHDDNLESSETMLNFGVSYAAMVDPNEQAILYALRGLFGGYSGQYQITPYYMKLREYTQLENRDIWEYRLELTRDQVDFILKHTYEIVMSYYDYFFFTENCAYHVLSILDVAFPERPISADFDWSWTTPVDTLKALNKHQLVKNVAYRASQGAIIKTRRQMLSSDDLTLAQRLYNAKLDTGDDALYRLPLERQAATLDLVYDFVRYEKLDSSELMTPELSGRERSILRTRSQIKIPSQAIEPAVPKVRPDAGHDTARVAVAGGMAASTIYQELSWRPAYHDLMDPHQGYLRGYGLNFLDIGVRHYQQIDRWELSRIKILEMNTLAPRDSFFKHWSWKVNIDWERVPISNEEHPGIASLSGGGGLSYELPAYFRPILFSFVTGEMNAGDIYEKEISLLPKAEVGALLELASAWQLSFGAKIGQNLPENEINYAVSVTSGIRLARNAAIRLSASENRLLDRRWREMAVALNVYF